MTTTNRSRRFRIMYLKDIIPPGFFYVHFIRNLFRDLGFFMLVREALGSFREKCGSLLFPHFTTIIDAESMCERPYLCLKETLFLTGTCPASPALQGEELQ
jgi:hypothetical protein